jgi:hypothetical protein
VVPGTGVGKFCLRTRVSKNNAVDDEVDCTSPLVCDMSCGWPSGPIESLAMRER